jgi:hypothetical protein
MLVVVMITACLRLQPAHSQPSSSTVINGLQCPDNVVTLDSVANSVDSDIASAIGLAGQDVTLLLEPGTYFMYEVALFEGSYCIIGDAARTDAILTSSLGINQSPTTTISVERSAKVGLKSLTWKGSEPGRRSVPGPNVFSDSLGALLAAEDVTLQEFVADGSFGAALLVESQTSPSKTTSHQADMGVQLPVVPASLLTTHPSLSLTRWVTCSHAVCHMSHWQLALEQPFQTVI